MMDVKEIESLVESKEEFLSGLKGKIVEALKEGPKQVDELAKQVGSKPSALASQFTYLRMLGFPVASTNGTVEILSEEEFAEKKEAKKQRKPKKATPADERLRKAIKTKRLASNRLKRLIEKELDEDTPEVLVNEHNGKIAIEEAKLYRADLIIDDIRENEPEVYDEVTAEDAPEVAIAEAPDDEPDDDELV